MCDGLRLFLTVSYKSKWQNKDRANTKKDKANTERGQIQKKTKQIQRQSEGQGRDNANLDIEQVALMIFQDKYKKKDKTTDREKKRLTSTSRKFPSLSSKTKKKRKTGLTST